jgi:hypothetical protein
VVQRKSSGASQYFPADNAIKTCLQGCGGGSSEVQASDEDKAKFKRAVEIVNELVDKAQ